MRNDISSIFRVGFSLVICDVSSSIIQVLTVRIMSIQGIWHVLVFMFSSRSVTRSVVWVPGGVTYHRLYVRMLVLNFKEMGVFPLNGNGNIKCLQNLEMGVLEDSIYKMKEIWYNSSIFSSSKILSSFSPK